MARKDKRHTHPLPPSPFQRIVIVAIVSFLGGALLTALVMGERQSRELEHARSATIPVHSKAVMRVASQFICPCYEKCTDGLDVCPCSHEGGAIEMKNFIQVQLDAGNTEAEVTKLFQKKYGGLKPERREELQRL